MSEARRVYANTIRISTTPNELVLEFGTFLPKSEAEAKSGPPADLLFDAQILMSPNHLDNLITSLRELQKRLAAARVDATQPVRKSN
jgi:hypothetical protein